MKHLLACLLVGSVLTGCASVSPPSPDVRTEVDQQQIAVVERAAARSGVRLIWLNAPTKKVTKAGS
jgi:hypothetical protein